MFNDLVQRTILGAQRKKKLVSVMLMDLDRFKEVNDTLGHHNGDLLLQRIAQRLQGVLRDGETIARLGGDEFAILIPEVSDRQACVHVAKRLLKTLEEPVVVGGLALQCEGSIGIALYPEHGKQVEAIMRAADVAMYVTKEQRSGHEFYDAALHEHRHDAGRLALVGELRRAMDEAELVLHYQPKVDLQTGKVKGVEALARWNHPERGLISPDEFIPLAERSNLLRPMTVYLLDTALRQCNAWRARGLDVSIAVNLSMQNLLDLRLPNDIARLLTSWRLPPGSLELEITESTIMSDHRRAMSILTRLNKMGVTLSIDDFGTGYSSLAYLQELPVSAVKIDKSFVLTMDQDPGNATIVQSTIDLGPQPRPEGHRRGRRDRAHLRRPGQDGLRLRAGLLPVEAALAAEDGRLARRLHVVASWPRPVPPPRPRPRGPPSSTARSPTRTRRTIRCARSGCCG